MRILIIGAGGHAQVVADILLCAREKHNELEPIGYLDDDTALKNKILLGLPVFGTIAELSQVAHDEVVMGIGDNATRRHIFATLQRAGERIGCAVHPTAIVAPSAQIKTGVVICPNAVVGVNARVGANVILNTSCTVAHDNVISDHAHLSVGVHLGGGNTFIGEGTLVGLGATVMPGVHVGAWSIIGAGALAHRAVPSGVTVVGVPARVLKAARMQART
jgi:sugar O-acyltransferase (sialic acid O-acetyltransferase NeuD family)